MEADRLYLEGQFAVAEKTTRRSKLLCKKAATRQLPEPILDLPSYPQQVRCTGVKQKPVVRYKPESWYRCVLVEQYPEFVPGATGSGTASIRSPKSLRVLEQATTLYPAQPDLVKAKVAALADAKNGWTSLAARQFALINANNPNACVCTASR